MPFPSDIGQFVIGESPIGVVSQSSPLTFPPTGPTSGLNILPSYLYVEYNDDDALLAFVEAYNLYAQAYLTYLNNLNLPIYTQLSGALLDWVAQGLYGIARPSLENAIGYAPKGPFNTYPFNSIAYNASTPGFSPSYVETSDDVFKRIITWAFYKGDGKVFTPRWLKRRINRFLNGVNGTDVTNDETYAISVNWTSKRNWTITLATTPMSTIFSQAVAAGVLELPFSIFWTVTLV